jgi:hypothetical protein
MQQNRLRRAKRRGESFGSTFHQVRVVGIPEIEVDTGDTSGDFIFRLLVVSRTGEQLALELPLEQFQEMFEAAAATRKRFPGGRLAN